MASDPGRSDSERGAVIVIVAAGLGAILIMAALVLDLSGARRDRDTDQVAADAMALAGASSLGGTNQAAVVACGAAWQYLVVNLPTAETAPSPSCSAFAAVCAAATARQVVTIVDEYTITFTHPVPAGHALMAGQDASANDGSPCDRFGVRIQQDRANTFASGTVDLDVDAVARFVRGVGNANAPLVMLSEHGCRVLIVSGNADLQVSMAGGEEGYIAIDSDGSSCTNPNKVVLDVNGQGEISADKIYMWALADGDPTSAYSAGLLDPLPTASDSPVGRSGMDWRYNCKAANGCPDSRPAYIDELVAAWGGTGEPTPSGSFTRWTTSGRSCSPTGTTVVPAGNWYIDCGTTGLSTGGTLTFQGGNIVSDGPIKATGTGGLRVNCSDANTADLVAPVTCPADPPSPSILVLRSGDLLDAGTIELRETMVYTKTGTAKLAGNNRVIWTAPNDPTFKFDDLALWTESTSLLKITGTTDMELEGIVFAPGANVELAGNTGTNALRAQIFASNAELVGGSHLNLVPEEDRILKVGKGHPILVR